MSRRIVVDASVARSAGETSHLDSVLCREFLQAMLKICHRVVLTPEIEREWRKHASRCTLQRPVHHPASRVFPSMRHATFMSPITLIIVRQRSDFRPLPLCVETTAYEFEFASHGTSRSIPLWMES